MNSGGKWLRAIGTSLLGLVAILAPGPALAQTPVEFIVRTPAATSGAVADRHGLRISGQVDAQGIFLLQAPAGTDPNAVLADIAKDPDVTGVEPNTPVFIPESLAGAALTQATVSILDSLNNRTTQPYFGGAVWTSYVNQPAAVIIRVADAQTSFATGAGIVAVIDTGVDPHHAVLQSSLVPGFDFTRNQAGFASDWPDLDQATVSILDQATVSILDQTKLLALNQATVSILDQATVSILDTTRIPKSFGHGTMVAGLIHLVAPTARIMPLKAFKADGSSDLFNVLQAIYYAAQHGANVINMSFSLAGASDEFSRAVDYATTNGTVCVASAGNSGKEVLVYPAALKSVVGVASTNNLDVRSAFSNYGNNLVSLAAPGEGLITTYPGNHYAGAWGTSFSTPLVAGGAALLFQLDPKMSPDKIAGSFSKAAKISQDLGAGRLDLYMALASRVK